MVYKAKWMREWLENSETKIQFMDHEIRGIREGSENTVARQHYPEYTKVVPYLTLTKREPGIRGLRDRIERLEASERDLDKIGLVLVALEEALGRETLTRLVKERIRDMKKRGDILV